MNKYIPFLKLKTNEFAAIKNLDDSLRKGLSPFFDVPRQDEDKDEAEFKAIIKRLVRKCEINLKGIDRFFVDNFDVSDRFVIDGRNSYLYILEQFSDLPVIPVTGLNRSRDRRQSVFDAHSLGYVKSSTVAVRLNKEDIEDYRLVSRQLRSIFESISECFANVMLIIDCGVCLPDEVGVTGKRVSEFLLQFSEENEPLPIVIAGSSITASIRDIATVESRILMPRNEVAIFKDVAWRTGIKELTIGDYTTVSPFYSDIEIPKEAMRNVITPKLIYPFDGNQYVMRGGALRTHRRGSLQYNDLAAELVEESFYRGAGYSFGDYFFNEKAHGRGKQVTPSNAVCPMVNAHITYMLRDFVVL
ncbi:hypothetical protein [Vogesella sp. LIG4]|uniref:beta family protein n=1 Tax=Vogesella sp. LIG4 TaxID=1192162 RepID=UPI0008200C5C|nr:hypothetical protein [Vogesella sp. LIG4]SCK14461.1 Beta protein [Vogesella sp. LIG4]